MRTSTSAVGGLMSAGTASTTRRTIFPLLPLSWSLRETMKTEKYSSKTTEIRTYIMYSSYWHGKAIETELRRTLVFDPSGCSGRLHACPFLGGRYALPRGGFIWNAEMVSEAGSFLLDGGLQHHFPREGQAIWYAVRHCGKS